TSLVVGKQSRRAKLWDLLRLGHTRGAGDPPTPDFFEGDAAPPPPPATGPEDHNLITWLNSLVGDQHAMRCAIGNWEGCSLLERHRLRHRQQLLSGNAAILRHSTIEHFAHQPFLRINRIDEDTVPCLPAGHAGPRLDHFSSHIKPEDHRQRHFNTWHTAHREDVVIVER